MILRQFLVYVIVGLLSATLDIGSMQLLLSAGMIHSQAVSIGFGLGLLFNYLAHQRVTFSSQHSPGSVRRYAAVLLLNYGLTLGCVEAGLYLFDSVLAGKLLSLPLVALNGFVLGRYWVFRHSTASDRDRAG